MGPCPRRIRITIKPVSSLLQPLMDWCDPAHCYSLKFNKCNEKEKDLRLGEMKEIMYEFKEVLWKHMDEEVKILGAENMRNYWTVEDIRRMVW